MSHSIYGLYDPTDETKLIRYVGYSSKSIERRVCEHIAEAKAKASCHRHKWIRSLIRKGVKPAFVKIESVTAENWQSRESFWIAFYQGQLVNSTSGGEGLIAPSDEVRKAISRKVSEVLVGNSYRKGIPHDEKSKLAISNGLLNSLKKRAADDAMRGKPGRKLSEEEKRKISEANKGRKHPPRSPEWIEKQRIAQSGKTQSAETIAKRAAKQIGNKRALGSKHSDSARMRIASSRTGGRWINNGISSAYIKAGESLPDGWNFGRLKKGQ